jgi:predicted RNA-binding protein YlxR (DUF448 family)
MIRLTAPQADLLKIDRDGSGRGGYLHRAQPCWQAFVKRKSVYRAFHLEVSKRAREDLVRALQKLKTEEIDSNVMRVKPRGLE